MKKNLAYILLFIIIFGAIGCRLMLPEKLSYVNNLNIFYFSLKPFYFCRLLVFVSIIILTLHLLLLFIKTFKRALFRTKRKKHLSQEILQKDKLIEKGKYIKALKIAVQYLHYYPNDEEIQKFKHELYEFTGKNPKKAEMAYKKIKRLKLNKPGARFTLSKRELAKLKSLASYHPVLKQFLATFEQK